MTALNAPLAERLRSIADILDPDARTAWPQLATALGLSKRETQRYSISRALLSTIPGVGTKAAQADAAFEIECSEALAKVLRRESTGSVLVPAEVLQRPLGEAAMRAMSTLGGSVGGYLIGAQNMGFVDVLRARAVAFRMGARILSGLKNQITTPRQTGSVTVTWQGVDGTSVNSTDQALGQLSMDPRTCIAITDVSEQLLRLSTPSADSFISTDLAAAVATAGLDNAVINGVGGAQPLGIIKTPGVVSNQDAATATLAKILAFPSAVGTANALRGAPGFVANSAGAVALAGRQKFTGSSTALWEGNVFDGELVGIRAMSSEQIAASNLIFGCWDEIVIGEWGVLELSADRSGARFGQAQVAIRALWMVDVSVRYPQSFIVSTNLS